jgi:DNA (cytosine-5)-methyltransferase 1
VKVLDLFCGAGGVSMGLHRAWPHAEIVGIDIKAQRRYPFTFIQADALKPTVTLADFDFIWASPPCQAHTSLKGMWNAKEHPDLIPQTRALLLASGRPWCMENVPGAPMQFSILLCGTMFGLGWQDAELRRHRLFETSQPLLAPNCQHKRKPRVIGVYGGHGRDRRRTVNTQDYPTDARREAMGIDWMMGNELSQAIPPAYSEFIAKQFAYGTHGDGGSSK